VTGLLGGRITWLPEDAAVWTGGAGGGGGGATWTGGAVVTGVRATVVGGAGGAGGTVVVVVVVVGAGRRPLVSGAVGTVLNPAAPAPASALLVWPALAGGLGMAITATSAMSSTAKTTEATRNNRRCRPAVVFSVPSS
jgi:hypothetical protein